MQFCKIEFINHTEQNKLEIIFKLIPDTVHANAPFKSEGWIIEYFSITSTELTIHIPTKAISTTT